MPADALDDDNEAPPLPPPYVEDASENKVRIMPAFCGIASEVSRGTLHVSRFSGISITYQALLLFGNVKHTH